MYLHVVNSACEDCPVFPSFGHPLLILDEVGNGARGMLSGPMPYRATSSRIFAMLKHETVDDG